MLKCWLKRIQARTPPSSSRELGSLNSAPATSWKSAGDALLKGGRAVLKKALIHAAHQRAMKNSPPAAFFSLVVLPSGPILLVEPAQGRERGNQ